MIEELEWSYILGVSTKGFGGTRRQSRSMCSSEARGESWQVGLPAELEETWKQRLP